jgi:hypothetical protein
MTITAKFRSLCPACGHSISPGEKVEWEKGRKAAHTKCPGGGKFTPLNNPGVAARAEAHAQSQPTETPAECAARFGRTLREGKIVSLERELGHGKRASVLPLMPQAGEILSRKDGVYMVVGAPTLTLITQDYIDDNDAFRYEGRTGWYANFEAAPVAPTAEEAAAEQAKIDKRNSIAAAEAAWKALIGKIAAPAEQLPAWIGGTKAAATWHEPAMVHTGSYPQIFLGEQEVCYFVPGYFAYDWDYPAVIRTMPLSPEFRTEITQIISACMQAGFLRAD